MKVYISVDMEGITGAAVGKHVQPGEREYERVRKLMTQDANAAIEGALAGGATDIVVSDGHGPMTNLPIENLHPAARLISGSNKLLGQMEAIDRGFDVAFFVGYHQREGGGDGVMNHTYLGRFVYEIRLNTEPVDEAAGKARVATPVTFEVDFKRTSPAHFATLFPGVERRGPRTIAITDTDYVRAFKLLWGGLIVALAVPRGGAGPLLRARA